MNRRNFLKAFCAMAGAAAVPLLPVQPAITKLANMLGRQLPAPTIVFVTSLGEMAFMTTPGMWRVHDETITFAGELSFVAEQTCHVYSVEVDIPGFKRIPFSLDYLPQGLMPGDQYAVYGDPYA